MTERELVNQVRADLTRLIDAVGEHRAAWALSGITPANLRRFAEAKPPAPVRPRTRRPEAESAAETRWELLEEIRNLVAQSIELNGARATARTIGKVSPPGLVKFAGSSSRPYRPLWRQLLNWYDAGHPGTHAPEPVDAIRAALLVLTRDLPADTRKRTCTELRSILRDRHRAAQRDAPPTASAAACDAPPARGGSRPAPKDGTAANAGSPAPERGGLLPGRRRARFRAGLLLRQRS